LLSARDLRLGVQRQRTDHGGDVFPSSADHGDDANDTESQRTLDSQDGCDHVADNFNGEHVASIGMAVGPRNSRNVRTQAGIGRLRQIKEG
jgi:hypothetical protein